MKTKHNYSYYTSNLFSIFSGQDFKGWGRKKSGRFASWCKKTFGGTVTLYEDGFIRSVGLGVKGSPSFSFVEDNIGIYYDASMPSALENILNTYNFSADTALMKTATEAMSLIRIHHISKYNHAPDIDENFLIKYHLSENSNVHKVLIISQTANDASLVYGLAKNVTTQQMIDDAIAQDPQAQLYVNIHPDVLSGNKESDIILSDIPSHCQIINEEINPISLLKHFDKVYTKTSGMGMEALILGKSVHCYGLPYYAGWGLTEDAQSCSRRTRNLSLEELFAGAYILYTQYHNPHSQKTSTIIETIHSIVKYRTHYLENEGVLYFFGFSRWKRKFTLPFFPALDQNTLLFCKDLEDALKKGLNPKSKIYIWGKKPFLTLETYAKQKQMLLHRVEDGFIRSISLGSDLTKAYSLVVDSRGIYFDPTQESDLEYLLNTSIFDTTLLERAKKLQHYLKENKISKYNMYPDKILKLEDLEEGQKVLMVPGQVEDDASLIYGAKGMNNLKLLQKVRAQAPDAYIIYKPHPDVLSGNRKGHIDDEISLKYCNIIIEEESVDSVLDLVTEVHTMTSLVGFEALLRDKKVYTYGLPFYAGWGLTIDHIKSARRKTNRTLDELVASVLILYPRYIQPSTNKICEIEVLLNEIDRAKKRYNTNLIYKLAIDSKNFLSRKIQFLIRIIIGE